MNSYLNVDNMRIEIAILQEEIDAFSPSTIGKFKIPTIMTEDTVATIRTSNNNIRNRRNGNIGSSGVNIDNSIDIYVPFEYTFAYGSTDRKIPKGTKFVVAFIGANVNDIRIIGRYDQSVETMVETLSKWIIEIIELDKREKEIVDHSDEEDAKIRSELDLSIGNINTSLSEKYQDSIDKINALDDKTTNNIQTLKTSLETKIDQAISDFESGLSSLEERQNQKITALDESLSQKITQTNTRLDNLKSSHDEDISRLRSEFDQSQATQTEELTQLIQDTSDNLNGRIDETNSNLSLVSFNL